MFSNTEIIIGELFPQPATGTRVFASVYATQDVKGEVSVTDESGQVRHSAVFELIKEGDVLELDISGLPAGGYQVFIRILGQQWECKLQVLR